MVGGGKFSQFGVKKEMKNQIEDIITEPTFPSRSCTGHSWSQEFFQKTKLYFFNHLHWVSKYFSREYVN